VGTPARTRRTLITIAHGAAGWALCGATMGIGMAATTLKNALVIHAAAVPLIFATVTLILLPQLQLLAAAQSRHHVSCRQCQTNPTPPTPRHLVLNLARLQ
jgi:hypothetical protein